LVQGFSGREDWGKLPEGAFGAGSQATVRWTPNIGNTTVLMLPSLPNADLLLRWHGSAIWRNRLRVFVNEQLVSEVAVEPGWRVYEVRLPAEVVANAGVIEVRFEFAEAHIPGEKDPQRFRGEQRVCNLALDWVQICTPNVPVGERKSIKWQPTELAEFSDEVRKVAYAKQFRTPLLRRRAVAPFGKILSTYCDGIPRDILIFVNSSRVPRPFFSSTAFLPTTHDGGRRCWSKWRKSRAANLQGLTKATCPTNPI
jgi:hypothetical protein